MLLPVVLTVGARAASGWSLTLRGGFASDVTVGTGTAPLVPSRRVHRTLHAGLTS